MNLFLWLGLISTAVLVISLIVDAFDGVLDSFDALDAFGGDWLSLPVLAAFVGAFGFATGATIDGLGPLAFVIGIAVGALFAYGAIRLTRALQDMPTDVTETESALLAAFGRIVTAPAPGRYGEVLLHRPNGPLKVACTAEHPIPVGADVVVVDVRSSTLVLVEEFDHGDT
jgi:membrane-bound ClpP family serine protease